MNNLKKENLELAKTLRHELHEHPELSNQEVWTKQHLIDFIKKNTKLEIRDKGDFFYVIYRAGEDKRNIAFRADIDALPIEEGIELEYKSKFKGVSHKCGHDGHAATLAGFALEIDQNGADKNIFFLFQPAEETGDGAKKCVSFIKENNIDEIFAYHNMSGMEYKSVNVMKGVTQWASKGMIINMTGSPSHASQPELGKNPAFPISKVIESLPEITSLSAKKGKALSTIVQVAVGEKAFGFSASNGKLLLTIRAEYEEEMNDLQKNIEQLSMDQAEKFGIKVDFSYEDEFPETRNHDESVEKIKEVCNKKNIKLVDMKESFRGSEDFGHYTKLTKGAMCYIGNGIDYVPLHTYEYDFPDELIETGVELFKGLVEV